MRYSELENKTVVITGANGGLGKCFCKSFLHCRSKVVAIYRKEKPLFPIIEEEQKNITYLQCDITNLNTIATWLKNYEKPVYALINNAGVYISKPLIKCDMNDWNNTIDTNLKGTFFLSQLFAKHMKLQKRGVIINIASFTAEVPSVSSGLYAASKSALISLNKSMASEWAPYNIRVNAINPGVVKTKMTEKTIDSKADVLKSQIAMQRFGTLDEIAEVVLFLASDASSYITGEVINVTGGKLITQNPSEAWG